MAELQPPDDLTSDIGDGTHRARVLYAGAIKKRQLDVSYSATPQFDASASDSFKFTLSGNVTSSTLINVSAGQDIKFVILQSGGFSFAWPSNLKGGIDIPASGSDASIAGAVITQMFHYDGTNARPLGPGVVTS